MAEQITIKNSTTTDEIVIDAETVKGQATVLTEGALSLLKVLCKQFAAEVPSLLAERKIKQGVIDNGQLPGFWRKQNRYGRVIGKLEAYQQISKTGE